MDLCVDFHQTDLFGDRPEATRTGCRPLASWPSDGLKSQWLQHLCTNQHLLGVGDPLDELVGNVRRGVTETPGCAKVSGPDHRTASSRQDQLVLLHSETDDAAATAASAVLLFWVGRDDRDLGLAADPTLAASEGEVDLDSGSLFVVGLYPRLALARERSFVRPSDGGAARRCSAVADRTACLAGCGARSLDGRAFGRQIIWRQRRAVPCGADRYLQGRGVLPIKYALRP